MGVLATFLIGPKFGGVVTILVLLETRLFYVHKPGHMPQFGGKNPDELDFGIYLSFNITVVTTYILGLTFHITKQLVISNLKIALARSQEAAVAKAQFQSQISHEMRTPLNAILGFTELLNEDPATPPSHHAILGTIMNTGKSLRTLIDDTLDFSKLQAGKMRLNIQPFQLDVVAWECCVWVMGTVRAKGIELIFDYPMATPTAVIGDPHRLRQIFLNLLSNASKFTSTGSVRLIIRAQKEGLDGCDVVLQCTVQDSGVGISKKDQERLFVEFEQVDNSNTRTVGGTGLGLAITRRLLELMNGNIWVESDPDIRPGCAFHLTIPLKLDASKESVVSPVPLIGYRIRLESRNSNLRQHVHILLESMGYLDVEVVDVDRSDAILKSENPASTPIDIIDMSYLQDRESVIAAIRTRMSKYPDHRIIVIAGCWISSEAFSTSSQPLFIHLPVSERHLHAALQTISAGSNSSFPSSSPSSTSSPSLSQSPPPSLASLSSYTPTAQKRIPRQREELLPDNSKHVLKILVAEDDPINRRLVQRQLEILGCSDVTIVSDGEMCVERFIKAKEPWDLIISDLQMPKLDGLGVVKRIREHEVLHRLRPTPVVAYTADVNFREEDLRALGMQGLLVKPADLRTLEAVLQRVLSESVRGDHTEAERGADKGQHGLDLDRTDGLQHRKKLLKRRDTS